MRADAERLLDRLGQPDLAYQEFYGRYSDVELWPLFADMLDDPRLGLLGRDAPSESIPDDDRLPTSSSPQDARAILGHLAELAASGRL